MIKWFWQRQYDFMGVDSIWKGTLTEPISNRVNIQVTSEADTDYVKIVISQGQIF